MGTWNYIFIKSGRFFNTPHEDMNKIIKFLKKEKVKRVLDLGCGSGRHTVLLAQHGFDVYGTDISKECLKLTKQWLNEKHLKAHLKRASCYKRFSFPDNFFDAVISVQVIHHNYRENIRYCISEIERVLKSGGILFVTVATPKKMYKKEDRKKYKMIKPYTYLPIGGIEKEIIHFLYTKQLLKKDFRNFQILKLHIDKFKHYCFLGRKK